MPPQQPVGMPLPFNMPLPGQPMSMPAPVAQPTEAAPANKGLTAQEVEAFKDDASKKQFLGDILYKRVAVVDERLAPRVTGMMLELPQETILNNINVETVFKQTVDEAIQILKKQELDAATPTPAQ